MYWLLFILPICNSYLNNWFPVLPIKSTDFSNPKQIRILGKDLVLWKKDEEFILQDNVCPHRCAPLSEGYIDKDSNNLRCAYHGWEFDETGVCTVIPQMEKENKKGIGINCLKTYPIYCAGDMLWMKFENKDTHISPMEMYDLHYNTDIFVRELPVDFYILLENFFDPAHIPFAHHKLQTTRDKACPINIDLLSNMTNKDLLKLKFNESNSEEIVRLGVMQFNYPCSYRVFSKRDGSFLKCLYLFLVPIQNDKTRVFISYEFNKESIMYKLYELTPKFIKHIGINRFLDSDSYLLYEQQKHLLRNNRSYHEHNEYYTPTKSDKAIRLYQKWIKKSIPNIPFFNNYYENNLSKKEVLDRYNQHTKDCKYCSETLDNVKKLMIVSNLTFLILFIQMNNLLPIVFGLIINYSLENVKNKLEYEDYVHNELD